MLFNCMYILVCISWETTKAEISMPAMKSVEYYCDINFPFLIVIWSCNVATLFAYWHHFVLSINCTICVFQNQMLHTFMKEWVCIHMYYLAYRCCLKRCKFHWHIAVFRVSIYIILALQWIESSHKWVQPKLQLEEHMDFYSHHSHGRVSLLLK